MGGRTCALSVNEVTQCAPGSSRNASAIVDREECVQQPHVGDCNNQCVAQIDACSRLGGCGWEKVRRQDAAQCSGCTRVADAKKGMKVDNRSSDRQ